MNPYRYPRTLNEAFGPYTSNEIVETDPPFDWQDVVVIFGGAVAFLCVMALLFWEHFG